MLKPEYLQSVPDRMVKLYAQAEADILADMARRISTYDYWIPAAEHQAKMLEEAGMTREEIIKRLKKLTGKTQEELKELMKEAGDILWQLAGLCKVMGWELDSIAQMNLKKLASRQKRGVIDGSGDNR